MKRWKHSQAYSRSWRDDRLILEARMRVLCLTPSRLGYSPGQRGSIELWESILTPAGIDVVFAPFETRKLQAILHSPGHHFEKAAEMIRGYVNRAKLLQALDEFDAVFIYREAALLGP